jgi:hypothetical protein
VAALVDADAVRKASHDGPDFEHIRKEFAELERFVLDLVQCRLIAYQAVVVLAHHRYATARGPDDVVVRPEQTDELLGHGPGVVIAPRVGHRLAAARLLGGVFDGRVRRKMLEQRERSGAHPRVELVDVAGDEEADAHPSMMIEGGPLGDGGRQRLTELSAQVARRQGTTGSSSLGGFMP